MKRCSPSVVPALPPTGATGVVSLKPTPAGSRLEIWIVAAWVTTAALASTATPTEERNRWNVVMKSLRRQGGGLELGRGLDERGRRLAAFDAEFDQLAVGALDDHRVVHDLVGQARAGGT